MPHARKVARETRRQAATATVDPDEQRFRDGIGLRLRNLRFARQMALGRAIELVEVAEGVGVTGAAYGRWENAKGKPTLANLEALAAYWQVHPGWLTFGVDPRERSGSPKSPADEELARAAAQARRAREYRPTGDARPDRASG